MDELIEAAYQANRVSRLNVLKSKSINYFKHWRLIERSDAIELVAEENERNTMDELIEAAFHVNLLRIRALEGKTHLSDYHIKRYWRLIDREYALNMISEENEKIHKIAYDAIMAS